MYHHRADGNCLHATYCTHTHNQGIYCEYNCFQPHTYTQTGCQPVVGVHTHPTVEAGIGVRGWAATVVVIACWWAVVVVSGDGGGGVVCWTRRLSVHRRLTVAPHANHRVAAIQGHCVRHRRDDCACGGGLGDLLDLVEVIRRRQGSN